MSGSLRFCLMSVALVFVFSFFAACDKKTEKAVSVLKRMETNYKSLKSFRADITMDKFNSQFGENDISKGRFIYLKPEKGLPSVRIDWTKPVEESLTFVNNEYTLYRPRLGQAIIGKLDRAVVSTVLKDGLDFLDKSKVQLKADLNFKYLGRQKLDNGILTEHLELTSKTAQSYKAIEFWTDKSGMLIQFKIILNDNDSITVLFTNIEKNINIELDVFKLNPPKNTKIIRG